MKNSQTELIKNFMELHGSITQGEATTFCGCSRLSARIGELKQKGIPIIKETVAVKKGNGKTAHIARYRLAKETADVQRQS